MDFQAYQQKFLDIMDGDEAAAPYDNAHYLNYVKLNWTRQQRWLKTGVLNEQLANAITAIDQPQHWMVIAEPWCGDAAHTVPFMHRLADINPLIEVDFQLRDSPPFLINSYLTNGSKSIPKLVMKDENDKLIGVWGSRPAACQVLYDQLERDHVVLEEKKIALQEWYNADKGVSFQKELFELIIPV
jgi:hypothetical protein